MCWCDPALLLGTNTIKNKKNQDLLYSCRPNNKLISNSILSMALDYWWLSDTGTSCQNSCLSHQPAEYLWPPVGIMISFQMVFDINFTFFFVFLTHRGDKEKWQNYKDEWPFPFINVCWYSLHVYIFMMLSANKTSNIVHVWECYYFICYLFQALLYILGHICSDCSVHCVAGGLRHCTNRNQHHCQSCQCKTSCDKLLFVICDLACGSFNMVN